MIWGGKCRKPALEFFVVTIAFLGAGLLWSQSSEQPAYLNTSLTAEQRAADLVHRMTVEEKVTQLVNQARAIPRLNVPAYDWWRESAPRGGHERPPPNFPNRLGLRPPLIPMPFTEWPS
jgi:beta-glucosidase